MQKGVNANRKWAGSRAFPTAVLTASGLKGIISAGRHPQANKAAKIGKKRDTRWASG